MKKQILTLAIIAMLPLGAMADVEITNADRNHIASTAYVKGAYNATMNAVDGKQNQLVIVEGVNAETGDPIGTNVAGAIGTLDGGDGVGEFRGGGYVYPAGYLISAQAVNTAMRAQRVKVYTTWGNNNTQNVAIEQPGLAQHL